MTTLTLETGRNQDIKIPGFVTRAITRIVEAWKNSKRYDKVPQRKWMFIEQNLTDPHIGPEIARSLR